MPHYHSIDLPLEQADSGIKRQILGHDSNLMLVKIYFDKGSVGVPHKHPHQQVSYVVSGSFEVDVDGNKKILKDGDSFLVPSDVLHGVVCLEEGVLIDAFSPRREDFLT